MGRSSPSEGRTILDVGGESTRPGAEEVSVEVEELRGPSRSSPTSPALGHTVSIDTSKRPVAEAALDAGAAIVNDVTALRGDPEMAALCADRGAELVLMHMQGDPRTMQEEPTYEDVVDDVKALPRRAASRRRSRPASPRSGSGSTPGSASARPSSTTSSCCAGSASCATSAGRSWSAPRARASSARSTAPARTSGSAARSPPRSSPLAAGADVLRVHDVAEAAQATRVAAAILG